MRGVRGGVILGMFVLATALLLAAAGCSTFGGSGAASGQPARARDAGPQPQYYDFGDVLVPHELKVDNNDSFVYSTSGFSAGVLVLHGRVELNSLVRFFENNMVKDNWTMVSSFKSPRTIMLFRKDNRWCVINITEGGMTTEVEIWVAPTAVQEEPTSSGLTESGLLR